MKTMVLIGVALSLAACHADTSTTAPAKTEKVIASTGYQKPGAAAEISYRWLQKPGVGSPGKLELTVISRSPSTKLEIELKADSALQLAGGSKQVNYQWQKNGEGPMQQTLDVTPSVEGLHYLNVIIHSTVNGVTRGRAYAIPVQVGAVAEKAMQHPHLIEQEDGSKIIELPAEER